jgi:hypothetical protein
MYRLMCLTLGSAAIACNFLGDPKNADCGTFGGRASGAASDSLTGCAVFAIEPDFGNFGLMLTNGSLGAPSQAVKVFAPGPLAGPIRSSDPPIVHQVSENGNITGVIVLGNTSYELTSGTVTVTASTPGKTLNGSVNLTGVNTAGVIVTVTGSFVARCTGTFQDNRGGDYGNEDKKGFCTGPAGAG